MQLPDKAPLIENAVVTSREEFREILQRALSKGAGAFLKVFAKNSGGKYYITALVDRSKVLAAECLLVDTKQNLSGNEAVDVLKSFVGRPMVVDVFDLDEIELKLLIAENIEAYSSTPKIPLAELLGEAVTVDREPVRPAGIKRGEGVKGKPEHTRKPEPARKRADSGKPEVVINLSGGSIPERAFQSYAEALLREADRIRGLKVERIEFDATVGEGVVYLNVRIQGSSTGGSRGAEIAEKRMLHAVSKYAPILLREAEVKPIIRDVSIIINGQEVKPQEIVDRDRKKTGKVTKDGRVMLSVLEDVWPYFSAFARTVINEVESSGIKVDRAHFDVKGRQEFEINLSMVVETDLTEDEVVRIVRDVLGRHARELARTIKRYITVRNVEVEIVRKAAPVAPTAVEKSGKAAEILAKKELLEREVEQLLKEAGIDELAILTEEKKKETRETMIRSRIEPAVETLKNRIHAELKLVPRVTFKWLKLNHEVRGSTVYIDIEASFIKENVGGLFGSFSGVSEDKIKRDIEETVQRIIREVSREYGIGMNLRRLNVIIR
ncbi:hypothetical protein [Thermococcus sp.]|uniref:hypothetical protein n=1 Tax=Thermococcus sp. TaxID=35749 RepID=UPI002625E74B|nr:hypothetical protein [Thermococcus sp.]